MRANDVTIGCEYRVKIGQRLAPVAVIRRRQRHEFGRTTTVFDCRTLDTGREITASAARLRPVPGTPEYQAEVSRKRAAERRRIAKTPAGTYTSKPTHERQLVAPAPVAGMVRHVDPARLVEPLIGANRQAVERIVAGVHVAMPWSAACRAVYRVIGTGGKLRDFPRELRRGAWLAVAEAHAANRDLYRHVNGRDPLPPEAIVAAALAGDDAARAAVLA